MTPPLTALGKKYLNTISDHMFSANAIRTPPLRPLWGTHISTTEAYRINCSKLNIRQMPSETINGADSEHEHTTESLDFKNVVTAARKSLLEHGIVHLKHIEYENVAQLGRFASIIMNGDSTYVGGANPRNPVVANVYETGAPLQADIQYHHEMAYMKTSVTNLAFMCTAAPKNGGNTFLSDNIVATSEIMKTPLGVDLLKYGIVYTRCLTDSTSAPTGAGVYNHWQDSFETNDRAEAQRIAESRGLKILWGNDGYMKTTYAADAFEFFPLLGQNLLYTSVADDSIWFNSWPGFEKMPCFDNLTDATPQERPLKMTLGNGREFTRLELQELINVYGKSSIRVDWEKGDIVIICNYRFAHGRPRHNTERDGEREIRVCLGPVFDRIGPSEKCLSKK